MKRSEPIDSNEIEVYWRILVRRRWAVYLAVLTFGLISLVGSFRILRSTSKEEGCLCSPGIASA